MEAPAPDLNQRPHFGRNLTIVEVSYADDNWARVSITRDERGIYRIYSERWEISDFAETGQAYWNTLGHSDSLTDDLSIAQAMAAESLGKIWRSSVIP
jgi:hypothetical protein